MKERKLIYKIIVILLISSILYGCSKAQKVIIAPEDTTGTEDIIKDKDTKQSDLEGDNEAANKDTVKQGITVNQVKYETIDSSNLPEQLALEVEALKMTKGYAYWLQEDGSYLILISAGEKSTGGYGIEVKKVEDNEGKTSISVIESAPEKEASTIQMISYPFVLIKTTGIAENITVMDQSQEQYPNIKEIDAENSSIGESTLRIADGGIDYSKPISGIYHRLVDNNTIEVEVNNEYMTFSADNINQYLEDIKKGDRIDISVEISPSDQIMVTGINKSK